MKLKIMTYNIASGRTYYTYAEDHKSPIDIKECAKVIKDVDPIFCGLNEINIYNEGDEADQPKAIANFAGFDHHYFSQANQFKFPGTGRKYGNAVVSKCPIISAETIMISDPERKDEYVYYETRAIGKVKLDIAGGITVIQTHIGLAVSEKQSAVDTLCKVIDETDGPIVLMGDFNIRPTDFLHRPIRERLFDTADIRDDYFKTYPSCVTKMGMTSDGSYTGLYPDCKIDYIYVSKHFKTLSLNTIDTKASDHLPLIAEVEI